MILKDPLDSRDLIFKAGSFPPAFDLKKYVSKIENQGSYNNCTNEAVAMAMEILVKQFKPSKYEEFSRWFVWWNTRQFEGNQNENAGVYPRNVVKAMEKYGNCYERFHGMVNHRAKPSKQAYKNAKKFLLKSYQRCETVEQIKTAIANGFPVIAATRLRENFGNFAPDYSNRPFIGGHATTVVGYTETHVILLNSWGGTWDKDGYAEMPWDMFMADTYDLWAITGIKNWLDRFLGWLK